MSRARNREANGSITKRGKRQFQAQITVQGRRHSVTYTSKTAAEEGLRRLKKVARRPDRMEAAIKKEFRTVGDALTERELELAVSDNPNKREKARNIRRLLRMAPELGRLRLTEVMKEDIEDYIELRLDGGRVQGTTVNKDLALLSKCFSQAGLENPVSQVGWFPYKRKSMLAGRLTPEQEKAILRAAAKVSDDGRTRIPFVELVVFALATGVRAGELVAMRWEEVRWHERILYLQHTKNGDERLVPLSPSALGTLYRLAPRDNGPVWGARYKAINRAWNLTKREACEELKNVGREAEGNFLRRFRMHDLRFEATCRMIEATSLTDRQVAQIIGHRTSDMLHHYSQLLDIRVAVRQLAEAEGEDWSGETAAPAQPDPDRIAARAPEWRRLRESKMELEARVWAQPITDLAEDLGVSDVALHKACSRLKVQKPPRGFWSRSENRVPGDQEKAAV